MHFGYNLKETKLKRKKDKIIKILNNQNLETHQCLLKSSKYHKMINRLRNKKLKNRNIRIQINLKRMMILLAK